jgi:GT2 family glycosyltransferase
MVLRYREKRKLFEVINQYHLFDPEWYLLVHADIRDKKIDPYTHYYKHGVYEGRNPHPLFSNEHYLAVSPDLKNSGVHLLSHYVFFGGAEGRSPHPLVAPRWLAQKLAGAMPLGNPLLGLLNSDANIGPRPLFDLDYIRKAQNQGPTTRPRDVLSTYFATAPAQRVNPNALFDQDFVRKQGRLPAEADAVAAYVSDHDLHLPPHPLFDKEYICQTNGMSADISAELTLLDTVMADPAPGAVAISSLFDQSHYSSQIQIPPDFLDFPILHYLQEGWKAGINPNPWFDTNLYVSRYLPDAPNIDPLTHYSRYGRAPHITLAPKFPAELYSMRFPQFMAQYTRTPLEHYIRFGRKESLLFNEKAWSDDFAAWDDVQSEIIDKLARLGTDAPEVSVIIPVYNQCHFTLCCLLSILRAGDATRLQIIIADDGSDDETQGFFSAIPQITYIRNPENLGFLRSCNNAAQAARADYLFFLNNDTAVLPGWIDRLIETARAEPAAGVIGSKLVYPDGTLQEAGAYIWSDGSGANLGRYTDPMHPGFNMRRDTDYISGAAILVPVAAWIDAGGFDPRYAPAYYEDADLAMRLRQLGWRVIYQPTSVVVHFEGVSSGTSLESGIKAYQLRNQVKFIEKWAFALENQFPNQAVDPFAVLRPARPRIMIIDGVVPDPTKDAGSVVSQWYMRLLIGLGYDVTFAALNLQLNGKAGQDLQALGVQVLHMPYVSSLLGYLETHFQVFDLFLLYRYGEGGAYIEAIRKLCPETPIIFNTVDLHHLREERQARQAGSDPQALAAAAKTKQRELQVMRLANETILLSQTELETLRRDGNTSNISVIPLVLETIPHVPPREGRSGIAFVGGYQHPPNVDAVLYFIDSIWPGLRAEAPDLVLYIVGSHPTREILDITAPGVVVLGHVEDLDSFLNARIATIAPLRFGAGIKGKIASSLAAGVPCVTSSLGAEGMGLVAGRDLLIADTPQDFATAVIRLCEDADLWSAISQNGQAVIRDHYSPEVTSRKLVRLLAKVGVAPFTGICTLTGQPEVRRFLRHDWPGSLSRGVGAPDTCERIAAAALVRITGHGSRPLSWLRPGALPPVALMTEMPNLRAALTRIAAFSTLPRAEIAVLAVDLGLDAEADLAAALAQISAQCRRIILVAVPVGAIPATAQPRPQDLAPRVRQLEAAGWEVRLEAMPLKDSALTGVVLIEARRAVQSGS